MKMKIIIRYVEEHLYGWVISVITWLSKAANIITDCFKLKYRTRAYSILALLRIATPLILICMIKRNKRIKSGKNRRGD